MSQQVPRISSWHTLLVALTLIVLSLVGIWKFELSNVAKKAFRDDVVNIASEKPTDGYYDTTVTFWEQGKISIPAHRTPVVPLFYLGLSLISRNYALIPFTQGTLFLIAVGVLCLSFWRLFGWTTGFALALAFIYFTAHSTVMHPHSEALSLILLVFAVCCFSFAWVERNVGYLASGCFICSLAILSRPALAFLLPLAGVIIILFILRFKEQLRRGVLAGALLIFPVFFWMSYNLYRGTTFSLSNYTWLTLASLSLPYVTEHVAVDEKMKDGLLVAQGVRRVQEALKSGYGGKLDQYMKNVESIEDPNCHSYLEMPYCIRSESMLVRYHLNTINYNVWVVMGEVVTKELGVKDPIDVLRILDGISRMITLDVIRNNPRPFIKLIWLNFWTTIEQGYLAPVIIFLALVIGIGLSIFSKTSMISNVGFLCMLLASIHVLHVIIISIFGGPLSRYYLLTRPFADILPVALLGIIIDRAWCKWSSSR